LAIKQGYKLHKTRLIPSPFPNDKDYRMIISFRQIKNLHGEKKSREKKKKERLISGKFKLNLMEMAT